MKLFTSIRKLIFKITKLYSLILRNYENKTRIFKIIRDCFVIFIENKMRLFHQK